MVQPLDLTSLDSIRTAAGELAGRQPEDRLADQQRRVMLTPRQTTVTVRAAVEPTNLGHFAFTGLLLEQMQPVLGSAW